MAANITWSLRRALADERRPLIILSFLVLIGTMLVGTLTPPDPALAQELERLVREMQESGYAMIFMNNAMIALTFFVPLLGLGSAFSTAYTSGAAMSAVAATGGINPQMLLLSTIIMPHSLIEFVAYSLALTENLVIMQKILARKGLDNEIGPLLASLVLVLALLLLGTVTEALTIELISGLMQ